MREQRALWASGRMRFVDGVCHAVSIVRWHPLCSAGANGWGHEGGYRGTSMYVGYLCCMWGRRLRVRQGAERPSEEGHAPRAVQSCYMSASARVAGCTLVIGSLLPRRALCRRVRKGSSDRGEWRG